MIVRSLSLETIRGRRPWISWNSSSATPCQSATVIRGTTPPVSGASTRSFSESERATGSEKVVNKIRRGLLGAEFDQIVERSRIRCGFNPTN
jgi:hypothetical protein